MFSFIRPQDIIDIVIMTFLVYQLYSWFKNTRALQVVIGLGFLGILYVVTKNMGLFMTSWILQELGTVLFVLIIVVFQGEIRHALYRFSLLRNVFGSTDSGSVFDLGELAATLFAMAERRTGAIVVLQRTEQLDDYLLHGVPLDSLVSGPLLTSIFEDGTPLHDGAVVIRDGRISQASCHLPLSTNPSLPLQYGTRHRAALGLAERSDAVVVVVSEERGEVSIAEGGALTQAATPAVLKDRLESLLALPARVGHDFSWRRLLFRNLGPKLATLGLVVISWLVITAKQGGIVTVTAPIKFQNLPESLALIGSAPETVDVQLKAISSLLPSPAKLDITATVDLAKIREGTSQIPVKPDGFQLPLGVTVAGVNPAGVKVTVERKIRRQVPVRLRKIGTPPRGVRLKRLVVEPDRVTIEGPEQLLARVEGVDTEELNLATIRQGEALDLKLLSPAPQVQLLHDGPVRVRVLTAPR
ncbi:MAG TPA: diadenylate cyclase CdaA [Geobacteraceae bacterium]